MSKRKGTQPGIQNIWMVTREYDGLAGAGGVKDVCRQLSETLAEQGGCRVQVVLPRYGFMQPGQLGFSSLQIPVSVNRTAPRSDIDDFITVDMDYTGENRRENFSVWQRQINGVTVYLIEAKRFAEKQGVYTYTEREENQVFWQRRGAGHFDYFAMNVLLQKAALALMMVLGDKPDIIHCQDGHTALIPAMIRELEGYRHFFRNSGTVVTIHNAGAGYHQDVGDLLFAEAITGLPPGVVNTSLLNGSFDPFLAAAGYAVMNTVSEQYARELQETPDDVRTGWLGHALKDRGVTLRGVTNGINPDEFDPRKPKKLKIKAGFDVQRGRFKGKHACKQAMLRSLNTRRKRARVTQFGRLSLDDEQPLYTFIGRLTHQKGVDVLVDSFAALLEEDREFKLLLLGSGEQEIETRLRRLAEYKTFAGQVCLLLGYDQELALKIYAAGDFFLIPSLFEPCGLTDYISQLFGNIPIVHSVGGLVKVIDGLTGFAYEQHTADALTETVRKSLEVYRTEPEKIQGMQKNAVRQIHEKHTWKKVMQQYIDLYRDASELFPGTVSGWMQP